MTAQRFSSPHRCTLTAALCAHVALFLTRFEPHRGCYEALKQCLRIWTQDAL